MVLEMGCQHELSLELHEMIAWTKLQRAMDRRSENKSNSANGVGRRHPRLETRPSRLPSGAIEGSDAVVQIGGLWAMDG